jgi:protein-S-isoprenylcysteine O-methyltransferase Ste14
MEYLTLTLLWTAWCAVHSGMISLTITNWLKQRLGPGYRFYRMFYNLFAVVTLVPLVAYSRGFHGRILFRWDGYLTSVQALLWIVVLALFIAGSIKYDLLQFSGIRQIRSGKHHSALSASGAVDTSGVLRMTRHPWYLAAMIFVWIDDRAMDASTLIVNGILSIYLVVGTLLEERKLLHTLGDSYRDYQNQVSMLFPLKWISTQVRKAFNHH